MFIAGGVGFAPIISMLRQSKAGHYPHPLRLIYGNRVETQILYREEIEALKDVLDFDLYYVLSDPPAGWRRLVGDWVREPWRGRHLAHRQELDSGGEKLAISNDV